MRSSKIPEFSCRARWVLLALRLLMLRQSRRKYHTPKQSRLIRIHCRSKIVRYLRVSRSQIKQTPERSVHRLHCLFPRITPHFLHLSPMVKLDTGGECVSVGLSGIWLINPCLKSQNKPEDFRIKLSSAPPSRSPAHLAGPEPGSAPRCSVGWPSPPPPASRSARTPTAAAALEAAGDTSTSLNVLSVGSWSLTVSNFFFFFNKKTRVR